MRRGVLTAALLLLILPGCASRERPEGIVERWLLALNQGGAGEPLRYADVDVTNALVPEWRSAEPGTFDVIEVGRGVPCVRGPIGCEARVPFRVELVDGREERMDAFVVSGPSSVDTRRRVGALIAPDETLTLPSEGGAPIESVDVPGWLIAAAVGLAILFIAEVVMKLVRRGTPVISSPDPRVGSERGGDRA
jgi:hypothetical protein